MKKIEMGRHDTLQAVVAGTVVLFPAALFAQSLIEQMTDLNLTLGRRHYHMDVLKTQLEILLNRCIRATR